MDLFDSILITGPISAGSIAHFMLYCIYTCSIVPTLGCVKITDHKMKTGSNIILFLGINV